MYKIRNVYVFETNLVMSIFFFQISIWECAYGSYLQLNDPDTLIVSMFKNEKVQLNLPGWKTRRDIFSDKDLLAINTTRKM